jgi:hypothetical protein
LSPANPGNLTAAVRSAKTTPQFRETLNPFFTKSTGLCERSTAA